MWLLESWNSKFTWHKKLTVSVGGFTDSVDIVTALADNFTSVYYVQSCTAIQCGGRYDPQLVKRSSE